MLKPYICVVCEKVIFAQDLVPSLINLFSKIAMTLPVVAPEIPSNAVAPKEWCIFASWDTETGDEQREFFFCVQVHYPDKSPFGEVNRIRVNVEAGKRAQMTFQMLGFPIGQTGVYSIRTWVEENQKVVLPPKELTVELDIRKQEED